MSPTNDDSEDDLEYLRELQRKCLDSPIVSRIRQMNLINKAKEQERLLARALRKTLMGSSWEKDALEAYDKACKTTDELEK